MAADARGLQLHRLHEEGHPAPGGGARGLRGRAGLRRGARVGDARVVHVRDQRRQAPLLSPLRHPLVLPRPVAPQPLHRQRALPGGLPPRGRALWLAHADRAVSARWPRLVRGGRRGAPQGHPQVESARRERRKEGSVEGRDCAHQPDRDSAASACKRLLFFSHGACPWKRSARACEPPCLLCARGRRPSSCVLQLIRGHACHRVAQSVE
mmetsp:Transcript_1538/g.3819  ORF Transcript_1538/g.3819 Transcript_1538/m.3819 type:complete len:210 (+) Transcript_1538:161-790(+)